MKLKLSIVTQQILKIIKLQISTFIHKRVSKIVFLQSTTSILN